VIIVGGTDTYYDYDEGQWKYRRLGGGPVHTKASCPPAEKLLPPETVEPSRPDESHRGARDDRRRVATV
jgi:hypothetical protein